jgi:hypothetical protein
MNTFILTLGLDGLGLAVTTETYYKITYEFYHIIILWF